jgi:hypothetical protein
MGTGIKNEIKIIKNIFIICLHLELRFITREATPPLPHSILSCGAKLSIDALPFNFTVIKFDTVFNNASHMSQKTYFLHKDQLVSAVYGKNF